MDSFILCPHCMARVEVGRPECPACRNSFYNSNPRGALAYATLLGGRYTVGKFLFADGEGCLYEAIDNEKGCIVRIKEYFPASLSLGRGPEGAIRPREQKEVLYKNLRMDFAELYRALKDLTPREGLQTVYDVISANNTVYAVLCADSSMTLQQYLTGHGGRVPAMEAVRLVSAMADGLDAMHRQGLTHRGICPDNVVVGDNGLARLGGYATSALRTANPALQSQLTDGFAAPEQYSAAAFDGSYTDVYGLAALLYRLVTGRSLRGAVERREDDTMIPASKLNPEVPEYFARVLEKALSIDPQERFLSVRDFMQALTSKETAEKVLKARKPKGVSLAKSLIAAALILLAVLGLLAVWLLTRPKDPPPLPPVSSSVPASSAVSQLPRVPDVRHMKYDQALNYYGSSFRFEISEEVYDESAPLGQIIDQVPSADETLEKGGIIYVTVSKGPAPVEMPGLKGWTYESAKEKLEGLGLRVNRKTMENEDPAMVEKVLDTDVEPGTQLKRGQMVTVYVGGAIPVSSEPEPEPEPESRPESEPESTPESTPESEAESQPESGPDEGGEGSESNTTRSGLWS